MILIFLLGAGALGSTFLCVRGWRHHFRGEMSFDDGMVHGNHMAFGTAFTLGMWIVVLMLLLLWLGVLPPAGLK
jgi:hypothetical protein